ncbi:hypothetical protein [Falsibacillus albus]|uniref:Uncharacterized protein n=1 Tax=Falsibacillus albus TaxID=2478915 RepID=A0A3L7JUJ9_9BACI|nr:hypothetical protein [Falsibacillus albus]RLQ93779.1 hypothetical protein D9X91_16025 [Falsibacillus albus]
MFSSINLPSLLLNLAVWAGSAALVIFFYRKNKAKLTGWKVFLATFVGLFSFSITVPLFHDTFKIALLPLGVWILFFIFRKVKDRWVKYRPFAWLGFFSNYLFLAAGLLAIPINHGLYPENEVSTYLSSYEQPVLIAINPSADEHRIDRAALSTALNKMKEKKIYSTVWYQNITGQNGKKGDERFPYVLKGTSSKSGSGIQTMVFVEKDGKGILVNSQRRQRYFHSPSSIWEVKNP